MKTYFQSHPALTHPCQILSLFWLVAFGTSYWKKTLCELENNVEDSETGQARNGPSQLRTAFARSSGSRVGDEEGRKVGRILFHRRVCGLLVSTSIWPWVSGVGLSMDCGAHHPDSACAAYRCPGYVLRRAVGDPTEQLQSGDALQHYHSSQTSFSTIPRQAAHSPLSSMVAECSRWGRLQRHGGQQPQECEHSEGRQNPLFYDPVRATLLHNVLQAR